MTEQLWYAYLSGNPVGPLRLSDLSDLVRRSLVERDTLVSVDKLTWQPASIAVPSLFGAADSPNTPDYFKAGERWYVNTHNGQQFGPVSFTELTSWVVEKRLTPNCLVRRESDPRWHRVEDVFSSHSSKPSGGAALSTVITPPAPSIQKTPQSAPKPRKHEAEPTELLLIVVGIVVFAGIAYGMIQGAGYLKANGWMPLVMAGFLVVRGLMILGRSK